MVRDSGVFVAAAMAAFVVWWIPKVAWACGAFAPVVTVEYGASEEVDKALVHDAEEMLYVDRGDGRWTVYQGRSIDADEGVEEFAWLLPVPGVPEVEVAPGMIFDRLAQATEPVFELEDLSLGACPAEVETFKEHVPVDVDGSGAVPVEGLEHDGEVRVVDAGSVGPYEHVTIETAEGLDDPAQEAVEWLEEHGYRVESVDVDLLREYLDDGLNLLAMRLHADAGAEDVQPVAITVEMERALSPMRLAKAGAAEETNILVWTAADGRAVPHGWPRVEIDEGLVDWEEGGVNYMDVVAAAVSEAGGRGFVTDYARATENAVDALWSVEEQDRWEELLERRDFTGDERETLTAIAELFGGEELLTTILRDEAPLPGSRVLSEAVELANFSAEYRPGGGGGLGAAPDPRDGDDGGGDDERQERDAGPEALLEALKGGELVTPCFADELGNDATAGGGWSARLRDPERTARVSTNVDSTLSSSFQGCIAGVIEEHLKEVGYGAKTFPAWVSFQFSNPYEYLHAEEGYPALQAAAYGGVEEVDWARVVERVDEALAVPLQQTRERLEATERLTRLSTAVAAENLTRDVSFAQVPGHGDVPATRTARRAISCGGEEVRRLNRIYTVRDWSMEFKRGESVTGRGHGWPVAIGERDAARLVVEYDRQGQIIDESGDAVDGEVVYIGGKDEGGEGGGALDAVGDGGDEEDTDGAEGGGEADEDAAPWWQWLLGAFAAFVLVSLVLAVLRRPEVG